MEALDIIMVPVADRQKAKEFYLTIGFQVVVEAPDPHGKPWIQMALPGSSTTISLADFSGLICQTSDIDREVVQLQAKGIEVGRIEQTPWGKFAWFSDRDGNRLCLHQK